MYLFLLFLLTPAIYSHDISKFINKDILYPKCCPAGYLLQNVDNSTFNCYENTTINLDITANLVDNCEKCAEYLVDKDGSVKLVIAHENTTNKFDTSALIIADCDYQVFAEITSYTTYPKCCPLGYLYDTQEHSCVYNESAVFPEEQGVFVKTSLSHCKDIDTAIIDHLVEEKVQVDDSLSVIFNGVKFEHGKYCFDESVDGMKVVRTCEDYSTACMQKVGDGRVRCLKKCCPDGEILEGENCKVMRGYGLSIYNHSRILNNEDYNYGIIIDQRNRYIYKATEEFKTYVAENGTLHLRLYGNWTQFTPREALYCMDYTYSENSDNTENSEDAENITISNWFYLEAAGQPKVEQIRNEALVIVLSISCVFAMATFICYLILPEMHNLFGKSIMVYCVLLTIAFSILAYVRFNFEHLSTGICVNLTFIKQFAFLAGFSWLNIICFDMWMAFGQLRVKSLPNKKSDLKTFIYYNVYGWSVPTIITLITYAVYITKCLPDVFIPHIGRYRCAFDTIPGTYDHYLYFIGPLAILILINIVLFLKTIIYCFRVKNQINNMKTVPANEKDRRAQKLDEHIEKLVMLLKLFLIMGVSWLFEVVEAIVSFNGNHILQVIQISWDVFNSLQGVFIFCIFILKKNVLKSLLNKIMPTAPKNNLTERSKSVSTTSVSGYSTQTSETVEA